VDVGELAPYRAFVEQHPEASVYHTTEWQQVIRETYGYLPHHVTAENAGRITGVLPLFEVHSLISGRHLTAIPFSHYVTMLYENDEALQSLVRQTQQIARQRGCRYVEVRGSAQVLANLGFRTSSHNRISLLDLRAGKKALWNKVHNSTQRNVKKAQKNNLTVRRGVGATDFSAFYRLILETRRQQGVPPYPTRLFAALQSMPQARLYLACHKGHTLAGIIVLCHGKRVIYAYGASLKDQEKLRMRPNDLLFWQVIAAVQAEGYETFDFGTTPTGNRDLLRFKENWGAQSELLAYAYWLNTGERIPVPNRDSRAMRVAGAFIRRMPLWALRLTGELLFEQLG
jgi:FemAB-related protein (PEP-CTERM system-associated)